MAADITVTRPAYTITVGVPAAMVRSYKQPLYDSEVALAAAPNNDLVFYQRPIGQANSAGVQKTLLHTNMRSAGQLGVPLSFDLFGFNVRVPKDITLTDFRSIFGTGVFEFTWGQDTVGLQVPLEDVPAGVDTEGPGATDSPHVGWGMKRSCHGGATLREKPEYRRNSGRFQTTTDAEKQRISARESDKGASREAVMRSEPHGDVRRTAEMRFRHACGMVRKVTGLNRQLLPLRRDRKSVALQQQRKLPNPDLLPFGRKRPHGEQAHPRVHARNPVQGSVSPCLAKGKTMTEGAPYGAPLASH